MKPVRGNTRSTGADEAGVQKVSARTLSRTFVQGPGQGQGLECQGPGPGLFLKDQDKVKDFTLVLKESLGQGQGLTSLAWVPQNTREPLFLWQDFHRPNVLPGLATKKQCQSIKE